MSCPFITVKGQNIVIKQPRRDTTYIKSFYRKHITIRAFESNKFNNFKFIDQKQKLIYKPNDHSNLGIGAHYKFISLNLGVYVPLFDKNNDIYGKTRQLDLQTHVYIHKFIIDLYGQFYKGYYLANSDKAIYNNPPDKVAIRPDVATRNISIVTEYVFNGKRFSYNAPFYQNEIQKKSAGSMLIGGGLYHTYLSGDSSFIPTNINYNGFYNHYAFTTARNTAIGFSIGYAYTFVIKKHFFITGALSGGSGLNYASLSDSIDVKHRLGYQLNVTTRLAAGYNTDKYFAGITYIRLTTETNAIERQTAQQVSSGNFRFILAKRFALKKTLIPKSEIIKVE